MVLLSTTSFKQDSNPSHLDEKLPSIQLENQTNPDLLPEKVEWNGTQSQRGSCLTPHNNGTTHGEWVGCICRWLHQATEWNISMHFQVWKSPCWYCSFTHVCTFSRAEATRNHWSSRCPLADCRLREFPPAFIASFLCCYTNLYTTSAFLFLFDHLV